MEENNYVKFDSSITNAAEENLTVTNVEKADDIEFVEEITLDDTTGSAGEAALNPDQMKKLQRMLSRYRKPVQQVRKFNKIGRNDPCPCGSGKKYKNCCLSKGEYEGLQNKQ